VQILKILVLTIVLSPLLAQPLIQAQSLDQTVPHRIIEANNHWIEVAPDISLDTRLYLPETKKFPGLRPTIIFASSWALDKYEYEVQARRFADDGFLVLSYTPRGFGRSDGVISGAGPNDQNDVSVLIDWLEANTSVDISNLAMAGISYGGGLALLSATREPRLKTVVSMSGWADLAESLYSNNTMHDDWIRILLVSGEVTGRMDPQIRQHIENVKRGEGIEEFRQWSFERSSLLHMDLINSRKIPIFVTSNYDDELFSSNQMAMFYDKIEGPKKMLLTKGIHFSSELTGLVGLKSAVWSKVHQWIKHWLVQPDPEITFGYELTAGSGQEFYPDLPEARALKALEFSPINEVKNEKVTFNRALDSAANPGIVPVVSSALHAHLDLDTIQVMKIINQKYGAVYETKVVEGKEIKLRGLPKVSFTVAPHEGPMTLVAYLYDTNLFGVGTLLSHGVYSFTDSTTKEETIDITLNSMATDLTAGHKLTLVIDGLDPLYLSLGGKSGPDSVQIVQREDSPMSVKLPIVTPATPGVEVGSGVD
jgi:pimeloyl-ACP methyl ester carboxylesterase